MRACTPRPARRRDACRSRPGGAARIGLAGALVGLVLLVGCRGGRVEETPEKLTLAVAQLPHAALVHVAAAEGYFAAEGLDVTLLRFPFGKPALDALLEGKADLATCADTPFVLAVLQGRRLAWLATIETSTENTVLVARSDAGIPRASEIAGKRVGFARGTNGEFFLNSLMVRHRIARDAVVLVDLRPDEMSDALAGGVVDAVAIWSPISGRIVRRMGDGVRTFSAEDLYFESFGLVGTPDLANGNPVRAQKVLRALLRAESFVRRDRERARAIVAREAGLDREEVDASWKLFTFQLRLDQSLLPLMEEEARWAIRSGLAPPQETPNFLRSLAVQPLLTVSPDAVTVMR